ncbi:solute carrier family 15 member 4-like [Lineus longissimus]|uniref:solute carrier family 15 member 4-like n=1 Tax=Lineus longissimus TaxID=88925 RepID=UPI00315CC1ED
MPDVILTPKTTKGLACVCILASEITERVAFYAFLAGLGVFLNGEPTRWTEINALNLTLVFLGVSYSTALFGSFLADVCIGRFWAIFVGFVLYLGGYIWWVFLVKLILKREKADTFPGMCHPSTASIKPINAAMHVHHSDINDYGLHVDFTDINVTAERLGKGGMPSWSTEVCSWPIVLVVCLIGLGAGIVRTNLAPYGALQWTRWKRHNQNLTTNANEVLHFGHDREQQLQPAESGIVREFFSWFFWASSTGSLVAIGALTYVELRIDYMHSAALAAVGCLAMAFVFFVVGGLWYTPSKTISRDPFLACLRAACCWCCRRREGYREIQNESIETVSWPTNENAREQLAEEQREQQQQQQQEAERATESRRFWYLAAISLVLIPYWIIYHQMLTTFPFQAVHMNIIVDGFYLPVPWMYLTEAVVIFIMIPLIYGVILPHMESRPEPRTISMRTRMGIGIVFAILSILAAGLLEKYRRERFWEAGMIPIVIHNNTFQAAKMTVFLQVPQYFLMGVGDAFSNVAGLELIYSQTPESMRGIAIGIFWLFSGFGSFLACALTVIGYNRWFFDWEDGSPNCKKCRVEYYYFIQAGLAFVCLVLFWICTSCCKIGLSHIRRVRQPAQGRVEHGVAPDIARL